MITQRQNAGGLVGGAILIGLGALLLLGQFFGFRGFEYLWPLFIVGMGAVFFVGMVAGGKATAPLAIPGSILTTVGLLALFQNFTGHWETWSYAWTAIIIAVGIGIYIMGAWSGHPDQRQAGLRLAGIGFVLLIVFGSFFELMLFGRRGPAWRQAVLPVLLILLGLYVLFRRSLPRSLGGETPSNPSDTRPAPPQG